MIKFLRALFLMSLILYLSKKILPLSATKNFDNKSTIVDLPDPDGPTIAFIFPILTLKLTSSNIFFFDFQI